MDHYPYPLTPIYPPVKVPYLDGQPAYDGGDFSTFPNRNGWDKREFMTGELKSGGARDAATFMQAWLYFGMASCVLGLGGHASEHFVVQDPDNKSEFIVSTEGLRPLMEKWIKDTLALERSEAKKILEKAGRCMDEASVFSQNMQQSAGPGFRLDYEYPEVRFSIAALGDQLWNAMTQLRWQFDGPVHRVTQSLSQAVGGEKSFLGKYAKKLEDSTTKALTSKLKNKLSIAGSMTSWGGGALPQVNTTSTEKPREDTAGSPSTPVDPNAIAEMHEAKDIASKEWMKHASWKLIYGLDWTKERPFTGPWNWGTSELMRTRMRDAGWCPYEAERAQDILSPWAVHFASALTWQHFADHRGCTPAYCNAHTIDESTYKTRHVREGCTCEFVGPPMESVHEALDEGTIPVIKVLVDPDTDHVTIEKVDKEITECFTAVSHVWSHGLGNAKENKVPMCHIARIAKLMKEREFMDARLKNGKIQARIWMDTLCVPLEKEYRKIAISRMTMTYALAINLYVLDNALLSVKLNEVSELEALIRLYCSAWTQRIWTFQEGASSYDPSIAFADGNIKREHWSHERFVRPDQPIARGSDANDYIYNMLTASYRVDWQCRTGFKWLVGDEKAARYECARITRIWNGLGWRASTKATDQPLIVSAMDFGRYHDIPIINRSDKWTHTKYNLYEERFQKIGKAEPEERWLTYYKEHDIFPQGILFVDCKTLPVPGFRWAPCEIGTDDRMITDPSPAKVTPEGLIVTLPGYLFLGLRSPMRPTFEFLDVAKKEWYVVWTMRESEQQNAWPIPENGGPKLNPDVSYGIIQGSRHAGYSKVPSLLVEFVGTAEKGIKVHFQKKVFMARVFAERAGELDDWIEQNPENADGEHAVVRAARYEENQIWCVG